MAQYWVSVGQVLGQYSYSIRLALVPKFGLDFHSFSILFQHLYLSLFGRHWTFISSLSLCLVFTCFPLVLHFVFTWRLHFVYLLYTYTSIDLYVLFVFPDFPLAPHLLSTWTLALHLTSIYLYVIFVWSSPGNFTSPSFHINRINPLKKLFNSDQVKLSTIHLLTTPIEPRDSPFSRQSKANERPTSYRQEIVEPAIDELKILPPFNCLVNLLDTIKRKRHSQNDLLQRGKWGTTFVTPHLTNRIDYLNHSDARLRHLNRHQRGI